MPVLINCKFDKDPIKTEQAMLEIVLLVKHRGYLIFSV